MVQVMILQGLSSQDKAQCSKLIGYRGSYDYQLHIFSIRSYACDSHTLVVMLILIYLVARPHVPLDCGGLDLY